MFLIKKFAAAYKIPTYPKYVGNLNRSFFSTSKEIERLATPYSNVTDKIKNLTDKKLYKNKDHPLGILTTKIQSFFSDPSIFKSELQNKYPTKYAIRDDLSPIVSTKRNFDDLLVPSDHPSRRKTDTYYVNETTVLRTHTSAHQNELIKSNLDSFIVFGKRNYPLYKEYTEIFFF